MTTKGIRVHHNFITVRLTRPVAALLSSSWISCRWNLDSSCGQRYVFFERQSDHDERCVCARISPDFHGKYIKLVLQKRNTHYFYAAGNRRIGDRNIVTCTYRRMRGRMRAPPCWCNQNLASSRRSIRPQMTSWRPTTEDARCGGKVAAGSSP